MYHQLLLYNVIWKYTWTVCKCTFEKYGQALERITHVQRQRITQLKSAQGAAEIKALVALPKD